MNKDIEEYLENSGAIFPKDVSIENIKYLQSLGCYVFFETLVVGPKWGIQCANNHSINCIYGSIRRSIKKNSVAYRQLLISVDMTNIIYCDGKFPAGLLKLTIYNMQSTRP